MTFSILYYNPAINEFSIIEVMMLTYFEFAITEHETAWPWIVVGVL